MTKFVKFIATGLIYLRDKKGKPIAVEKVIERDGVARNSPELPGKVFRQCPDLLPCDWVKIETVPLG